MVQAIVSREVDCQDTPRPPTCSLGTSYFQLARIDSLQSSTPNPAEAGLWSDEIPHIWAQAV